MRKFVNYARKKFYGICLPLQSVFPGLSMLQLIFRNVGDEEKTSYNIDPKDGEKIRGKRGDGGPWNKVIGSSAAAQEDSRSSTPGNT